MSTCRRTRCMAGLCILIGHCQPQVTSWRMHVNRVHHFGSTSKAKRKPEGSQTGRGKVPQNAIRKAVGFPTFWVLGGGGGGGGGGRGGGAGGYTFPFFMGAPGFGPAPVFFWGGRSLCRSLSKGTKKVFRVETRSPSLVPTFAGSFLGGGEGSPIKIDDRKQ